MRFTLECRPRFDYGRAAHELSLRPDGAAFHGPDLTGYIQASFPLRRDDHDVRGEVTLHAGEVAAAVFTVCDPTGNRPRRSAPTG